MILIGVQELPSLGKDFFDFMFYWSGSGLGLGGNNNEGWNNNIRGSTHMIGGCVSVAVSKGFVKRWHLLDKGRLECLWWSKKGHCEAVAWRKLVNLTC